MGPKYPKAHDYEVELESFKLILDEFIPKYADALYKAGTSGKELEIDDMKKILKGIHLINDFND